MRLPSALYSKKRGWLFEVLLLVRLTKAMQGEGVGPYTCRGILHEIGPQARLSDGRVRQYFVVQVGVDVLLMEAYDDVGEAVRKMEVGTTVRVEFVIRGWRWYPPEREARYLLRLTARSIEVASL